MARGQHKAVPVEPLGVLGVVLHDFVVKNVAHRGAAHGHTRVATLSLVHTCGTQENDQLLGYTTYTRTHLHAGRSQLIYSPSMARKRMAFTHFSTVSLGTAEGLAIAAVRIFWRSVRAGRAAALGTLQGAAPMRLPPMICTLPAFRAVCIVVMDELI